MKKTLIIVVLVIILILSMITGALYYPSFKKQHRAENSEQSPPIKQQIDKTEKGHPIIAQLAGLKGRAAGSKFEKEAATILAREFVNLDLDPLPNDNNFYFQTFNVPKRETYISGDRLRFRGVGTAIKPSQNVLGFLPGKNKEKILIFTAHYDGQGINDNQVYESANDNLSGVYVLLNLAEYLKNRPTRNLSYLFVAFGSEEIGLYGSEFFVQNLPVEKEHILGVINCDTVSSQNESMILQAFNKNSIVMEVEKALLDYSFDVKHELSELRTSDHYHFAATGLNALTISAGDWLEGNHTPEDTFDKLNFKLLDQLSKALVDMVLTLDELST